MRRAERGALSKKHEDGMRIAEPGMRNEKHLSIGVLSFAAQSKFSIVMRNHATNQRPRLNSLLVPQSAFRIPHSIHVVVSV
jgi:hypothetical protein